MSRDAAARDLQLQSGTAAIIACVMRHRRVGPPASAPADPPPPPLSPFPSRVPVQSSCPPPSPSLVPRQPLAASRQPGAAASLPLPAAPIRLRAGRRSPRPLGVPVPHPRRRPVRVVRRGLRTVRPSPAWPAAA